MRNRHYTRALWNLAILLFIYYCLWQANPALLSAGIGKLIAFLMLLCLLLFVVEHSADIRRVALSLCKKLCLPLFALVVQAAPRRHPSDAHLIPDKPALAPLFQRPPPIIGF
jgi:hypothetical protein